MESLADHPTVKPVALVADALLDCTQRGDLVLDQFAGSGTILLAATKVGRIAYAMEYEPRYVDVAIQRWQGLTKLEATLAGDGRTFEEMREVRTNPEAARDILRSIPPVGKPRPKPTPKHKKKSNRGGSKKSRAASNSGRRHA